jgi:hypothetical protein
MSQRLQNAGARDNADGKPCTLLEPEILHRSEADIDEALIETFPASDPPSWAGWGRVGSPKRSAEGDCAIAGEPPDDEPTS